MEDYIKKAADAFLVERPYGMRVDYSKRGYVLFNRNLNVLGNGEYARLEELPLEEFDVDEIPLEGEIIKEHAGFTDVFFYSDCTNPYAGYVLDLKKLKVYNQFIYPFGDGAEQKTVIWSIPDKISGGNVCYSTCFSIGIRKREESLRMTCKFSSRLFCISRTLLRQQL